MDTSFLSVNESHLFVFPIIDFNGSVSGATFAGAPLKLPGFGKWWVWGVLATRVETNAVGEMANNTNWFLNIYDAGQSQFWWTGGQLNANVVMPIQHIAGKAGKPGLFTEPKLIDGGSTLIPYLQQTSGATPTGASQAYVALLVTLADSAAGGTPVVPSLGGVINAQKGEHYKALIKANFATNNLAVGASQQFVLPLNKQTSFIISQLLTDLAPTDTAGDDPRVIDENILVNIFDTRTTWLWASPQDIPVSLMLGVFASRPFVAPTFFYMAADQNLAIRFTNNTNAALVVDINTTVDGYIQDTIVGSRVQPN